MIFIGKERGRFRFIKRISYFFFLGEEVLREEDRGYKFFFRRFCMWEEILGLEILFFFIRFIKF